MAELGIGDIVRITVTAGSEEEVDAFAAEVFADPELSQLLAAMPEIWHSGPKEFGGWELFYEFIVAATSGAASTAIVEAVRAAWARAHARRAVSSAPRPDVPRQPGQTPQPQQITLSIPTDGIAEITIHLDRHH